MESVIKYKMDASSSVKNENSQNTGSLTSDEIKWIHLSAGISKTFEAVLISKCSESAYSPS